MYSPMDVADRAEKNEALGLTLKNGEIPGQKKYKKQNGEIGGNMRGNQSRF